MKRKYISPEAEIEKFTFTDIVTESITGGINDGNEETEVTGDF